jgi:DNA-binding beta-propeller fold protein YncE
VAGWLLLAPLTAAAQAPAPRPPERSYSAYVVSEAIDSVQLLRFGPEGLQLEKRIPIGVLPTDVDGPHGVAVAPDGKHYFVSLGHGTPYGSLWRYSTGSDRPDKRVALGLFPATVALSPDGYLAYVANFNLYGDKVPSSVSVVATDEMAEIKRITTCTMPHGSRLSPDGSRHYSACMMDDMLVEIDTRKLAVSRYFVLRKGAERGHTGAPFPGAEEGVSVAAMGAGPAGGASTGAPAGATTAAGGSAGGGDRAGHDMSHGMEPAKPGDVTCSPTWAQPSADGRRVFVACNKTSDIAEIDAASWTLVRRLPAGDGVYNLAVTHDGKLLLATNKRGQSVSVLDTGTGQELKRLPTRRKVVHGVAVTSDDRYAFVSVEGVGSEPGTVEVIDLRALATVATVDVGAMAAGVEVWAGR